MLIGSRSRRTAPHAVLAVGINQGSGSKALLHGSAAPRLKAAILLFEPFPHVRIASETGLPSPVIMFKMRAPILASVSCVGPVRLRSESPMMRS